MEVDTDEPKKLGKNAVPWVEKYRPKSLDDLIAHEDIIRTLNRFIFPDPSLDLQPRIPHLLLYGPPGTGKTSTILAITKQLFPTPPVWKDHVLELNASDDRGINVVREKILNFVQVQAHRREGVQPAFQSIKIIILDEADAMTKDAQNALRRIIEKYTKTTRFCLICNYVSKMIPAIQSRCTRFRFAPLDPELMRARVQGIIDDEGVNINESGKHALLDQAKGDMRRALNVLQSTHLAADEEIDDELVYKTTGQASPKQIKDILEFLFNDDVKTSMEKLHLVQKEHGIALQDMLEGIHDLLLKYDMSDDVLAKLIQRLAEIEWRLSKGCADEVQLGALVAAFHFCRHAQINKDLSKPVKLPTCERSY